MTFDVWGHSFLPSHLRLVWIGLGLLAIAMVFILRRLLPRTSPLTYLLGPFEWSVEVVGALFVLYELGIVDVESPVQETLAYYVGSGLFLSLTVVAVCRIIRYRAAVARYFANIVRSKAMRIAVVLVVVQVASWWWFGRRHVDQAVPSMAEAVMDLYQRNARRLGVAVNGKMPPLNLVVCEQLRAELGAKGFEKLQTRLKPYDVSLFTEASVPRSFLANRWKCEECQVFCALTKFNSPFVATVETWTWWGMLDGNGFTNVSVFLFGRWFRVATWQTWVA